LAVKKERLTFFIFFTKYSFFLNTLLTYRGYSLNHERPVERIDRLIRHLEEETA